MKRCLRGLKSKNNFLLPDLVSVILNVQRPDFSRYPQSPSQSRKRTFEKLTREGLFMSKSTQQTPSVEKGDDR